eukprot:Colp12_sorted_trinity150504_noHs@10098
MIKVTMHIGDITQIFQKALNTVTWTHSLFYTLLLLPREKFNFSCSYLTAAAGLSRGRGRGRRERHVFPAVRKDAKMGLGGRVDEIEVRGEACFCQHVVRVAADKMRLSSNEDVVSVQFEGALAVGDGSLVHNSLAVVLAVRLEGGQLEETVGGGEEADVSNNFLDLLVTDCDRRVIHQTGVGEAGLLCHVEEIVPIQGPREALSVQHGVLLQGLRDPPVTVYIAEVKLTTRFEHTEGLSQDCVLVGGKIDHAVGDDNIEIILLKTNIAEPFNIALLELDIWRLVSKGLSVEVDVLARHGDLLVSHIHANNSSIFAHEARRKKAVSTRARPQI